MAVRDVSGTWQFDQSTGHLVTMELEQNPEGPNHIAEFRGRATTDNLDGEVHGHVSMDSFTCVIDWDRHGSGSGGEYDATFKVTDQGNAARLTGTTFDLDNIASHATWRSRKIFPAPLPHG